MIAPSSRSAWPLDDLWLWVAQLRQNDAQAGINEYNGARLVRATSPLTIEISRWYLLEVRVVGDSMELRVDGLSVVSADNSEAGTQIGLYGFTPDVVFDDIKVRRLVDPAPSVALGTAERACN